MSRKPKPQLVTAHVAKSLWTKITPEQWLALLVELRPDSSFRPHGSHLKGRCVDPRHDDSKPSLYVTPSKGIAKCFSCPAGGRWTDPIRLVETAKRVSYAEAVKFLRSRFGLRALLPDEQVRQLEAEDAAAHRRTLAAKVCCAALLDAIAHRGEDAWHWSEPALAWLDERQFGGSVASANWEYMTERQLIGLVPPKAYVENTYGANSPALRAYLDVLAPTQVDHTMLAWIVLPWHRVDGRVGRIKVRSHVVGDKSMITIDPKDSDGSPGFYGLRAAQLGGEHADIITTVAIAEGEPDALQWIASDALDSWSGLNMLAAGGSSSPSPDVLAPLGITQALVVQDRDAGGINFVVRLARETTALTLRPFTWPEEWIETLGQTGKKVDLDEAIKQLGFPRVRGVVADGATAHYVGLATWCAERAARAARGLAEDDHTGRGKIAINWGSLVHDAHERAAYVGEVAEQLGINAATLARELGEARCVVSVESAAPRALARAWRDEMSPVARYLNTWWRWRDGAGCYVEVSDEEMDAAAWEFLDRVVVARGDESMPLEPKGALVTDVLRALPSTTALIPPKVTLPHVLAGYNGPDVRRLLVVRNGLVDRASYVLYPPTPNVFATSAADVIYDLAATCPQWELFLDEVFLGDAESIRLLQQLMGWILSDDDEQHAIILLVGEKRTGKGTIGRIVRRLVGEGNVCSTQLVNIAESRFGLEQMIGKRLCIMPDERINGRADQARIASALLSASGGDAVEVDRKNRTAISIQLRCKMLIMTNEAPAIADASGALASRFRVVQTRQSFYGREDGALTEKLALELPGILNWCLRGWADFKARGWATPSAPTSAAAAAATDEEVVTVQESIERLGSRVKAFLADCCDIDPTNPDYKTPLEVLWDAWVRWCSETGQQPGSRERFAADIRAAEPRLVATRPRVDTNIAGEKKTRRPTTYWGVRLRDPAMGTEEVH